MTAVKDIFQGGILFAWGNPTINVYSMDSKALTTVLIVIICVLLFPVAIGIVGGIFGLIGGVIGGIFGFIGGLFGLIVGAVASVFGAIFGLFGWMFNGHDHWGCWDCSFSFFDGEVLAAAVLVLVIVMITRSKRRGPGNRESSR